MLTVVLIVVSIIGYGLGAGAATQEPTP